MFKCAEKTERDNGGLSDPKKIVDVRLVPTYDETGPNKTWSKWTPAGEVKMTITNDAAADAFEVGVDYRLTFTREQLPKE
ncbi:MAG TPA: hypothetical protein VEA80_06610 [Vitreimonas sp.]|uniref:hypothetical protein n=1 Tax=Vitreimonas sp. TaxID=3069702 RepID=UPI002D6254CE|nr:hypothetical protein [Vitreimonas sp.]HYD87125.1 hypothetical protein [Vitreimonas sp.]